MKRRLLAFLVLPIILLAVFATGASAIDFQEQRLNAIEKFQEKKEDSVQKFEHRREKLADKFATKTAEMREKFKKTVNKRLGKVIDQLQRHKERLYKIADKIQTRLDKIKGKGVDTSSLQAVLDSCNSQKTAIDAAVLDAKSKVDAIDTGGTDDGAIKAAYKSIRASKEKLVTYRKCLGDVVAAAATLKRETGENEN